MHPKNRFLVPAFLFVGILTAGLALQRQTLSALPEYTEKEKKECDYCHPAGDLFALTDAGKYYAEHHSLEGFEKPAEPAKPQPQPPKPKPVEPGKSALR